MVIEKGAGAPPLLGQWINQRYMLRLAQMPDETAPVPASLPAPVLPPPRLVSLDALRGFDMCWILGLSGLVEVLLKKLDVSWKDSVIDQLLRNVF